MKWNLIFLFLFLNSNFLLCQKEADIWYFGQYAGLDFNSGEPVPLYNSAMSQYEGSATISDSNGNLLFYTNGQDVWNRDHQQMANGSGLLGGQSSTQSSIIVKKPGNSNIYYVFTVPEEISSTGLRYSTIDISLNGGLGEVTEKNIFLAEPTEEKVTAVKHHNNKDIWVITHLWNSSQFYVYLVTKDGINTNPKIIDIGSYHQGPDVHGSMKVSPDGEKIVIVNRTLNTVELFDFDNSTGEITNYIPFQPNLNRAYGLEFSKDASLLYVGDYYNQSKIIQFDLKLGNQNDIINSGIIVGTVSNTHLGALQMGPDGKIYVSKHNNLNGDDFLGVIEKPEVRGIGCNFVEDGLYLGGRKCYWGLPTFIQSYFYQTQNISVSNYCFGDSTIIFPNNLINLDSVIWNFGDPSSGILNFSNKVETGHVYSSIGNYLITLISYFNNNTDTSYLEIEIHSNPLIDLGNTIGLCSGEDVTLDPGYFSSYLWQNGSTNETFTAVVPGIYWVQVTNDDGCRTADTVDIYKLLTPDIFLGNDTLIPYGDNLILNPGNDFTEYIWQDNSTEQTYVVYEKGIYWVNVFNGQCWDSDTINVDFFYNCNVYLPNVFTPNGDGINDMFYAIFNEEIESFSLIIFNRWGEIFIETNDIYYRWDGKFKGKAVPDGVYFWVMKYNCKGSSFPVKRTGSVTVLR